MRNLDEYQQEELAAARSRVAALPKPTRMKVAAACHFAAANCNTTMLSGELSTIGQLFLESLSDSERLQVAHVLAMMQQNSGISDEAFTKGFAFMEADIANLAKKAVTQ